VVSSAQFLSVDDEALRDHENSYLNEVEYVEQLDTPPNPSLVPKYFVEAAAAPQGATQNAAVAATGAAAGGATGAAVQAPAASAAAASDAATTAAQMQKLANIFAAGGPQAEVAKQQMTVLKAKLRQDRKSMTTDQKIALRTQLRNQKRQVAAATAAASTKATQIAALKEKRRLEALQHQKDAEKRAKKTTKKVRKAMKKIRRLSRTMENLQKLMNRINGQVQTLLPDAKIKKMKLDEVANISNSKKGKKGKNALKTTKESKLVNGFKKKPSKKKLKKLLKKAVEKGTPSVKKLDDLSAQKLAQKQKELSKFTKKLAAKDKVSLV